MIRHFKKRIIFFFNNKYIFVVEIYLILGKKCPIRSSVCLLIPHLHQATLHSNDVRLCVYKGHLRVAQKLIGQHFQGLKSVCSQ